MSSHSYLAPSSSQRWLNCSPSLHLAAEFNSDISSFALEGTEAHALCEHKLKNLLGLESKDPE